VTFHSVQHPEGKTQVWIAAVDWNHAAPQSEWIAVTDGKTFAQDPCCAANGNVLYFVSERDGFRCLWGQPLHPVTKQPKGDPFSLRHFHSARESLRGAASSGYLTAVSAARGRVVFAFPALKGSVWLEETPRKSGTPRR